MSVVEKGLNESMILQILEYMTVYKVVNIRPRTQQCSAFVTIMGVPYRGRSASPFTMVCANIPRWVIVDPFYA